MNISGLRTGRRGLPEKYAMGLSAVQPQSACPEHSPSGTKIVRAESEEQIEGVRELFLEYAETIGAEPCFQGFDDELRDLPGEYGEKTGRLLITVCGGEPAGCAALRKFEEGVCEMKRLYVRPPFRGKGIGRACAVAIIEEARAMGYRRMVLDTLPVMREAIALYRTLGFKEAEPCRRYPRGTALFMGLDLRRTASPASPG